MNNNVNKILDYAILKCSEHDYEKITENNDFNKLYPYTTENINGYISQFDLENKSLLTVGSSSDQIINSAYFDCNKQTIIDLCPYTKYFFYLKKAAILKLKYHEFLEYICYRNYPFTFTNNKKTFDIEYFNQIKGLLKELNDDAYYFWDELYYKFRPIDMRTKLFNQDEDKSKILRETNTYLKDKFSFNKIKEKIIDINPTFINGDISNTEINDKFDNIWFSNIGAYHPIQYMKNLLEKYEQNLNINGKMLICYLYNIKRNIEYNDSWESIYNFEQTYNILGEYISEFIEFIGISGIIHDNNNKDGILVYKKTK